jgi:hypothetical protein
MGGDAQAESAMLASAARHNAPRVDRAVIATGASLFPEQMQRHRARMGPPAMFEQINAPPGAEREPPVREALGIRPTGDLIRDVQQPLPLGLEP